MCPAALLRLMMLGICTDNICDTARVSLSEMADQAKSVHAYVLENIKPVPKTRFKFPMYNQMPSNNNQPVKS